MALDYINEAFRRLDLLEEQMFDTSLDGVNKLSDFIENDSAEEIVRVIDPEAETDKELKDSYVGKVLINCNVCHSHIFKNKEEINIEEDGSVNIDVQCPYCGEQQGFTIVGEIAPYSATSESTVETDTKTDESEVNEETDLVSEELTKPSTKFSRATMRSMKESMTDIDMLIDRAGGISTVRSILEDAKDNYPGIDCNDLANMTYIQVQDNISESDWYSVVEYVYSTLSESKPTEKSNILEEDFKEVSITTDTQHMEMTSDEEGKLTVTTEPLQDNTLTDEDMSQDTTVDASDETSEDTIIPVSDETEEEILSNNDVEEETPESDEVEEESEDVDLEFDDIDEEGLDNLGESYLKNVYENVESFKTTNVSANSTALIIEGMIKFSSGAVKKTGFVFKPNDANSKGQVRFTGSNSHLTESKDAFSLVGTIDNRKLFVESLKYNYKLNEQPVRGLVRRK